MKSLCSFALLAVISVCLFAGCGLAATGPSLDPLPDITGITPDIWSKSSPSSMTVHGNYMDHIPKSAVWTITGCDVAKYSGDPVTQFDYRLVLTPGPNNRIGDWCGLRLKSTGQALSFAFKTSY